MKNIMRFDFDLTPKWFEENYTVLNADKCHFISFLSLIISFSITAMKRKYWGLPLTTS